MFHVEHCMKTHKTHMNLKDHSVSGERFKLLVDPYYGFLYTDPKPSDKDLKAYYSDVGYISHNNQLRSFVDAMYHVARYVSLKRKIRLIKPFMLKSGALLDIGAGTGHFVRSASLAGWDVTGIEPSSTAREIANSKGRCLVFDEEALGAFSEGSFDVITLWHVLEHLPSPLESIEVFKKLLKPNGRIFVAVPNYKSYDSRYFKNFWAAYDVPRHLWHFSKNSIIKVFSKSQMSLESTHPMLMDAYYVSMLSNKYKSGSHKILNSLWRGLLSNAKAFRTGEYSSLIYVLKKSD